MSRIDETVVERLVQNALRAALTTTVVFAGEADPTDVDKWARLLAVDVQREETNQASDQPEFAHVLITLAAHCSVAAMDATASGSSGALASWAAKVGAAIDQQYLEDDTTTHRLHLSRARSVQDPTPDPERRLRTATVTVEGTVERQSGTTLVTLP